MIPLVRVNDPEADRHFVQKRFRRLNPKVDPNLEDHLVFTRLHFGAAQQRPIRSPINIGNNCPYQRALSAAVTAKVREKDQRPVVRFEYPARALITDLS